MRARALENILLNFAKLEKLYSQIPPVPCLAGCTGCCVSPTVTMMEYLRIIQFLRERFQSHEIAYFILKPMKPHPKFAGNFFCPFQSENGHCTVHPARGAPCRLHGLPVLDKMNIQNMENCTIMDKKLLPDVPKENVGALLENLMAMNRSLFPSYGENFSRIIGLNMECWTDIYFGETLTTQILRDLQRTMRALIPPPELPVTYIIKTQINEMVGNVELLDMVFETGDSDGVEFLLNKLEKEFSGVGSYFLEEIQWFRKRLSALNSEKSNPNSLRFQRSP